MHGKRLIIDVSRSADGRCVASFHSDPLDAAFAASFPESLPGSVALHRFASMVEQQYGKPVELRIDEPFPVRSKAVEEMLKHLQLEPAQRECHSSSLPA